MSEGSGRFQKGRVQGSCFLSILPRGVVGQPGWRLFSSTAAHAVANPSAYDLKSDSLIPFPVEISLFIPNQNTQTSSPTAESRGICFQCYQNKDLNGSFLSNLALLCTCWKEKLLSFICIQ